MTRLQSLRLLWLPVAVVCRPAQERRTESFLGNTAPIARSIQQERGFPLDYAHRGALPVEEWQRRGRAEVRDQLSYWPGEVPLDVNVQAVTKRAGHEIRTISFAGSPHYRVPAFLPVSEGPGPFPGIVALHDHGRWFFHGKEKLVRMEGEHAAIQRFRDKAYDGRAYAEALARRGFVVIVPGCLLLGRAPDAVCPAA
ncbi:MAG: hypothetical protein ACREH8_11600 [Opitutaceae bacterium]